MKKESAFSRGTTGIKGIYALPLLTKACSRKRGLVYPMGAEAKLGTCAHLGRMLFLLLPQLLVEFVLLPDQLLLEADLALQSLLLLVQEILLDLAPVLEVPAEMLQEEKQETSTWRLFIECSSFESMAN